MEWIRGITLIITLFGVFEYIRFYVKHREPIVIAPLSWLIMVLGYSIFKWLVGSDLDYYTASVIWSNVLLIQGVIITIAALIIFRGVSKNGH
jgi:hypothetical protein